jgi:hypothetical protein
MLVDHEQADQGGHDDGQRGRDLDGGVRPAAPLGRQEVRHHRLGERPGGVGEQRVAEHDRGQRGERRGPREEQEQQRGERHAHGEVRHAPAPAGAGVVGPVADPGLHEDAQQVVHAHEQADDRGAGDVLAQQRGHLVVVEIPGRLLGEERKSDEERDPPMGDRGVADLHFGHVASMCPA